jgi:DNA-directed RNA polymerase specialized sigma24 family protein
MHLYEERWLAGMQALPALPRILFRLRNFYDVAPAVMAQALATDVPSIALCLAEARSMIQAHGAFGTPERFPPEGHGLATAMLEQRVRQQYRAWTEQTLVESGYTGAIKWPDSSEPIEADHEAVATCIILTLPPGLRKAVERARRRGIATTELWRHVLPWRRLLRRRLNRVQREIRYSGWRSFDEWLADRVAPDRHYPDGYSTLSVRRRPLPDEEGFHPAPDGNDAPLSETQTQMQERFDSLPPLTQDAWLLFNHHGRTDEEIAKRLCISRGAARRRINRATYIICGWRVPSLAHRLSFDIKCRWARRQRQFTNAWAALRD